MLKKYLFVLGFIGSFISGFSQEGAPQETVVKKKLHGTFYAFWGYNRDWYSKSTITFENHTSDNYDFTLIISI